jgi:SAM-dependent methyltransferase
MRSQTARFIKRAQVKLDDFVYKVILKNLLKTSKLGYGCIVEGAESGINYERMYNQVPEGRFLIGKFIDKALLDLKACQATRRRKDEIKSFLWNEIQNNNLQNKKTKILDLASGGARYLRELREEHNSGVVESVCVDKDLKCVHFGRALAGHEKVQNIRFLRGDLFKLNFLKKLGMKKIWRPNVIVASGLLIYFNDEIVKKIIQEIYSELPPGGVFIFQSYENLDTKKLMRKTMATSKGENWTLYYREPVFWRKLLSGIGFCDVFITQDQWRMNNVCAARKPRFP